MKTRLATILLEATGIGTALFIAQSAHCQTLVYANDTTYQNATFNFNNGAGFGEAGNEVVLAGGSAGDTSTFSYYITQAAVQFALTGTGTPTGSEQVELNFYENNGPIVYSYYNTPSSLIWSSGFSTLSSLGLSTFTDGSSLTYTPNVLVPADFTWTLVFQNLSPSESAGLALYSPATVGANFGDAWENVGTANTPVWDLVSAGSGDPALTFGATLSVPEPSTIALGVMGGCAILARLRRKS